GSSLKRAVWRGCWRCNRPMRRRRPSQSSWKKTSWNKAPARGGGVLLSVVLCAGRQLTVSLVAHATRGVYGRSLSFNSMCGHTAVCFLVFLCQVAHRWVHVGLCSSHTQLINSAQHTILLVL